VSKVILESRLPEIMLGTEAITQHSIHKAVEAGADVAQQKVTSQAASRGYALQVGIGEDYWSGGGKFYPATHTTSWGDDPWFLRFFEYGTVAIEPMPFMRPGSRKMRKVFIETYGPEFSGWVKKNRVR